MGAAGLLAVAPHLVLRAIEDGVPLPTVVDLIHLLSEQLAETADGQARSLSALNSTDAVEAYQLAAAKSGPLGSLGAQLGARIASADPDLLEKYTTYGWHLAVFSQLLNDARDAGPGGPHQKRDVRAGSRTVPLVFAHSAGAPPELHGAALSAWEARERERIAVQGGVLAAVALAEMGGNLLAGTLLLATRALNPANRDVLAPLALGITIGIVPLAFLNALPQVIGRPPLMSPDAASASVAAIPMAFAYTILRHRLFALDARVRRFVFRACAAVAVLGVFIPTWLILRGIGITDPLAMLVGVLLVALSAPTIFDRTQRVLESWFYPPLGLARAGLLTDGTATGGSVAKALAVRGRELVPTRWVVVVVHDSARARDGCAWAVLASDVSCPTRGHQWTSPYPLRL